MRALTPWTGMTTLKHEVDRIFDRFFDGTDKEPALGDWAPAIDVADKKDAFVATVEVPGVEAGDLDVSVTDDVLSITGEKRQEAEEKDANYYRCERSWGTFTRRVRLPGAVEESKVTASFKNGVLTVTLPEAAGAKSRTVPVKAA